MEKICLLLSNILIPFNWFLLPIGIIWISFDEHDIFTTIISGVIFYLIFQLFCYLANFVISLLYLIIMPINLIFYKVKQISILLHIIFFTTWSLIAYYFSINISTNHIKPISLILYAGITLPFVYYCRRNINDISAIELIYVHILQLASLVSCISLLLFNIDMYTFGTIFVIVFLCGTPIINHFMKEYKYE